MLFELIKWWNADFASCRFLSSLLFRSIMAGITAFAIGIFLGPFVIKKLYKIKIGQIVRFNGPPTHLIKTGIPTMGGGLILFAMLFSTFFWADLRNHFIWVVFVVTLGFGAIGWVDDYRKVVYKNTIGMSAGKKFFLQSLIGVVVSFCLLFFLDSSSCTLSWDAFVAWLVQGGLFHSGKEIRLVLPFFKPVLYPLGLSGFIILSFLVIVGTSNAVNLTDGLDGLVAFPVAVIGSALGIFACAVGNVVYSQYLFFPHIPGAEELLIFCIAMLGACLAFLWYNTYPAQIFMGDVGALALGGALGTVAVVTRQEIMLCIMGGIFVAETSSVILQILFFKWTRYCFGKGRRLFRMAPLHHHFELSGLKETQVVVRFWIVTILLVLIGLSTLNFQPY